MKKMKLMYKVYQLHQCKITVSQSKSSTSVGFDTEIRHMQLFDHCFKEAIGQDYIITRTLIG